MAYKFFSSTFWIKIIPSFPPSSYLMMRSVKVVSIVEMEWVAVGNINTSDIVIVHAHMINHILCVFTSGSNIPWILSQFVSFGDAEPWRVALTVFIPESYSGSLSSPIIRIEIYSGYWPSMSISCILSVASARLVIHFYAWFTICLAAKIVRDGFSTVPWGDLVIEIIIAHVIGLEARSFCEAESFITATEIFSIPDSTA